jgi:glycerol-3-phosphate dehydrogenase (NAD(P)+)
MHISVLGAGAWGTALALQLAKAGATVTLWTHNHAQASAILASRQVRQLPNHPLPESIEITADFSHALANTDGLLISVPSHAFEDTLQALADWYDDTPFDIPLAWATKGFDPISNGLLHQRVAHYLPSASATVLSGPTFALEVAKGLPTAMVAASAFEQAAIFWAQRFHAGHFRVYTHTDVIGVEIGGAVKNVMAIAAGLSDGLGFGANARAALIARALAEIMRLGHCLGAQPETLMGLTGLGDLVLTCTDNQSRNRRFGLALAEGSSVEAAVAQIGTVEGIAAAQSVVALATQFGLDMPIAQTVHAIVQGQITPHQAVAQLLSRTPKAEMSS